LRVDAAVSAELLRVLAPLGIEAALHAIDARAADNSEVHRQAELALTQARYEAGLARRQYDAVDPDNRLVASELERRWKLDGEIVPASEKLVSLFEPHADIIVKGGRLVQYGHKVNLATGKSGLILARPPRPALRPSLAVRLGGLGSGDQLAIGAAPTSLATTATADGQRRETRRNLQGTRRRVWTITRAISGR
jgi:hypothetical protein